jgi:hypothetical protein
MSQSVKATWPRMQHVVVGEDMADGPLTQASAKAKKRNVNVEEGAAGGLGERWKLALVPQMVNPFVTTTNLNALNLGGAGGCEAGVVRSSWQIALAAAIR